MNIIKIAVKRRITVMMLFVCIVMLGLVSFGRLGMDLMPDMEIPVAMVMTTYSGAGSEEVESMITDTIETAVASVEGVQDIYSISSTGSSMVMVQYDWGTDLDIAGLNLRERVAMVEGYLPEGVDDPMVMKMNMNHGIDTLPEPSRNINIVATASGIIHSARVSLISVAPWSACSPYTSPAPTTLDVSCMAIAAHVPN